MYLISIIIDTCTIIFFFKIFGALLLRLLSVFQMTLLILENLIQIMTEVYGGGQFFIMNMNKNQNGSTWFW